MKKYKEDPGASCLDEADLVHVSSGHFNTKQNTHAVGNLQSVVVGGEADVSLLCAVRADQGVNLGSLNVVQLLDSVLDVPLVGLEVNDEDQGVVVLNLLHGRLGVERVTDSTELVHTGKVGNRLASVLGLAGKTEGVGAVERHGGADLARTGRVGALESGLLSGLGLGILGLGGGCRCQ
jgi:hypothetical protein